MKKQIQAVMAAVLVLGTLSLHAQTDAAAPTTTKTKKAKRVKKVEESKDAVAIRELQEKMAAQQAQIDALTQQNAAKDAALSAAQSTAASAQTQAAEATSQAQSATAAAQSQADSFNNLKTTVTDLQTSNASLASTISTTKSDLNEKIDSPASIHYKGITITPVAFFAAEDVYRQRAVNSDINTPFNSIPLPSANQGHVSEFNFSGRQSRLGGLFSGDAGAFKLSGYFEADFLGSGTTSNGNQSNSYVLRQRQIWGQAAMKSGFTITGGQMWSLVTETGKGTDNRTEKLPNSIDAQYTVGFNWARQPAIRIQQRWGDYKTGAFTMAMSVENAQITNFTATSATSGAVPTNFFFAGAGQNGGLYNAFNGTYANNVAPDVVVKGAWDMPMAHIEVGGIARFMRDYYFPILTTGALNAAASYTYSANYVSNTRSAGGVFGSVRVSPSKFVDLAVQAMAGQGVGRYGSSQLADATLRPDGTLEPIRNYHGLLSIETHPTSKLDVYAYYGGEYAQRTVYTTAQGYLEGYGAPNLSNTGCYALPSNPGSSTGGSPSASGCASPTRYIQEGMVGFTYRVVNSPKYGRFQYQVNYQYIQRNLWSGIGNAVTPTGPRGLDNMIFTSMRYYIP
jgi:multidrug efflux pump subunit AcrA (membrane-fusion protein)